MPKKKKIEEMTPEEQLKALEAAQNARRGKFAHFNLYPDNPVQMRFFTWLTGWEYVSGGFRIKTSGHMASGCFILHQPEKDEKKPHIHILAKFDAPHSQLAYAKLGGECEYQVHDDVYVYDKDLFEDSVETLVAPVLRPKLHAETVQDPQSMLYYMTHETFAAEMDGKKVYSRNELHWFGLNPDEIRKLYQTEKADSMDIARNVISIAKNCRNCQELIWTLISSGMVEEVEYVRKNAYFVKTFLCGYGDNVTVDFKEEGL